VATSRKKLTLIIDNENKTHFSWCVFDCDLQNALLILISLISTKHDLLSFQIFVSKFESWKGRHFYGGPGQHLASLRHWLHDDLAFYGERHGC